MSIVHGPNLVRDGLIFYVDAANDKSYPETGTTWFDLSGNNYDGTLEGGVTYNNVNERNLITDGTSSYIYIPDTGPLAVTPSDSFTVEVVFSINSIEEAEGLDTNCAIFGRGSTNGSHGIGCEQDKDTGQLEVTMGSRGGANPITERANIDNDKIYHGTFSYTPTIQKAYLNGEQYESGDTTPGASGTFDQEDWSILRNKAVPQGNGRHVSGSVFLARLYNRALTEEEVQQNYNALRGRFGL